MRYLLRRAAHLIAVLFAVSFVTFFAMNVIGDPVKAVLEEQYANEELREQTRRELGLDGSVFENYAEWVTDAVQGDFGRSYDTGETVSAVIGERLPVSLMLMVFAQLLALAVAIPVAMISAYRVDRLVDRASTAVAFAFVSVPGFAAAVILLYFLALRNDVFPARYLDDSFGDRIYSLFLPALSLALPLGAVYMRILRTDMASTLQEEFVMFARSKGVSPSRILLRHALRPSAISMMTVVGIQMGALLGGTLVVENIFSLPGLGTQIVRSSVQSDVIVIQAIVLVLAAMYVFVNFCVDALHGVLDPRIRAARVL